MEQHQWRKLSGERIRIPIAEEVVNVLMREREAGHEMTVCIGTDSQVKGKPNALSSFPCIFSLLIKFNLKLVQILSILFNSRPLFVSLYVLNICHSYDIQTHTFLSSHPMTIYRITDLSFFPHNPFKPVNRGSLYYLIRTIRAGKRFWFCFECETHSHDITHRFFQRIIAFEVWVSIDIGMQFHIHTKS